jgi:hypothetical protein
VSLLLGKQALIRGLSVRCLITALSGVLLLSSASPAAAASSVPPAPSTIRVENMLAGTSDVVTVTGLTAGDTVKVYADGGTSVPLGSATIGGSSNSASINISQLGVMAGYIYVTVTQSGYSESRRIVKSFLAEPLSVAPAASSIRVTNKPSGTSDSVTVLGLHAGDKVSVYADAAKTSLLGSATTSLGSADGTVLSITQLGTMDGILYIAVTEPGRRESRPTEKAYAGEAQTDKPHLAQIRIVNALNGTSDHVVVTGLQSGDVLKLYETEKTAVPLAQASVASGMDNADVIVPQLGLVGGSIYLTLTRSPLQESARVSKQFQQEPVTPSPAPGMIIVTNEPTGTDDRIELYGLSTGDIVNVYPTAAASSAIGTTTAGSDSIKAAITIPQLGKEAGHVYVTITSPSKGESRRVVKSYAAELASAAPERSAIRVVNALGTTEDIITLTGLLAGDTAKVYADEASEVAIGSGTVADGTTSVAIHAALPEKGYGIIYTTITRPQEEESSRTPKIYAAEPVSLPLTANQIRVSNTAGSNGNDEITAIGIKPGDVIKLYADAMTQTPVQTVGIDASALCHGHITRQARERPNRQSLRG